MANYTYTGVSVYLKKDNQSLDLLTKLSEMVETLRQPLLDINENEELNHTKLVEQIEAFDEDDVIVEHSEWFYGVDESVAPNNTPNERLSVQLESTDDHYYLYIPYASKRKNNVLTQTIFDVLKQDVDQIIQLACVQADESQDFEEVSPKVIIHK